MTGFKDAGPILVVEDDENIAALIGKYLRRDGFRTVPVHDGARVMDIVRRERPALVILDLMLPNVDGWEICDRLRQAGDTPVLMLTARGEEEDRIRGFSLGADDYVVKPFSPRELVERVKAILRRSRTGAPQASVRLTHGPLALEPDKYRVTLNDEPVSLTASEYTLLHTLMSHPARVYTRDELLNALHGWGEAVVDRVVDVHVGNLRQKIEPDPSRPRFILTKRGVGYYFTDRDAGG